MQIYTKHANLHKNKQIYTKYIHLQKAANLPKICKFIKKICKFTQRNKFIQIMKITKICKCTPNKQIYTKYKFTQSTQIYTKFANLHKICKFLLKTCELKQSACKEEGLTLQSAKGSFPVFSVHVGDEATVTTAGLLLLRPRPHDLDTGQRTKLPKDLTQLHLRHLQRSN